MNEKTVVVVLVLVLAGAAVFYFATRTPAKPAAKTGGGNAALSAACTALGLPASACTALAPLAGDITDTGVKVGKDALGVVTTASSEGASTVNTFIKAGGGAVRDTAGYFAEGGKAFLKYGTGVGQTALVAKEGAKVVEGAVAIGEGAVKKTVSAVSDVGSGAKKVAEKVYDTIKFW